MSAAADRARGLVPDSGYALVQVDTGEPPGEAGNVLAEFDDEDGVIIPSDTDFEMYVVYDSEGNTYTKESWPEPHKTAGGGGE